MADSWDGLATEAERLIAEHAGTLGPQAVAQIRDFLGLIRERTPLPEIGIGYWRTSLRVCWREFEVEVFETLLEAYDFSPGKEFGFYIRYFEHLPGEAFSVDLMAMLKSLQA